MAGYLRRSLHGRARILIYSILTYSVFTGITATTRRLATGSVARLGRFQGWAQSGRRQCWSAETWPAQRIGAKRSGSFNRVGRSATFSPRCWCQRSYRITVGVRCLWWELSGFADLVDSPRGAQPAIWIHGGGQRAGRPHIVPWTIIGRPPLLQRTLLATLLFATTLLFAYWGLFTWVPTFLASPVSR